MPEYVYWIIIAYLYGGMFFDTSGGIKWYNRILLHTLWLPVLLIMLLIIWLSKDKSRLL